MERHPHPVLAQVPRWHHFNTRCRHLQLHRSFDNGFGILPKVAAQDRPTIAMACRQAASWVSRYGVWWWKARGARCTARCLWPITWGHARSWPGL